MMRWPEIFKHWQEAVRAEGATFDPLFTTVVIDADPARAPDRIDDEREFTVTWWAPEDIAANTRQLQINLDGAPGMNTIPVYDIGAAAHGSLRRLWPIRNDPEKVAAYLIFSSIYARTHRGRLHPREYPHGEWPPEEDVMQLRAVVEAVLDAHHIRPEWHHSVYNPLPYQSFDHKISLADVPALIRYIGAEHAQMLREYTPVAFGESVICANVRLPNHRGTLYVRRGGHRAGGIM
jgi:hypothetical protein